MAHIADIIKYEGDSTTLVWKHPLEDFNSLTQLIVHESQEAIFFMNGQALDLFEPGRYTLETQNLPILGKLLSLATMGKTSFHCEVYFINKAVAMGVKWGTDSRVRFIDPLTNIPLEIGASGEINLQVQDSRKLLTKLVGTGSGLSVLEQSEPQKGMRFGKSADNHKSLQTYFRAPLMTVIKSHLASTIRDQQINILEADAHLEQISNELKKKVSVIFEEYGLFVPQFYVTTLLLPEDDKNFRDMRELIAQAYLGVKTEEVRANIAEVEQRRKIIEKQTEAQLLMIQAQGEAEALRVYGLAESEVMRAKGYTEKDKIDADVQKAYAESLGQFGCNIGGGSTGGSGGVGADMVSMMAGLKVAETMLGKMDNMINPGVKPAFNAGYNPGHMNGGYNPGMVNPNMETPAVATWSCVCGEIGNTKNFCMNCGNPKPVTNRCSNCGTELGSNVKFCPECGTKL